MTGPAGVSSPAMSTIPYPEPLTMTVAAEGFEPIEGWRREARAFCPRCTMTKLAAGADDDEKWPLHRLVTYRNPDPIHDGTTWDWREYGQCTECEGEWRLVAEDRESAASA